MSKEKSDQNKETKASRADDLLLDYFDQMFVTPPHASKSSDPVTEKATQDAESQPATPVPPVSAVPNEREGSDPETKASSDESFAKQMSEADGFAAEPVATSHSSHPNLKPASAILARKQLRPFKESNDKKDVVVAGLMPKLKPAAKQPETKTEAAQTMALKEATASAHHTEEPDLRADHKLEAETTPIETVELKQASATEPEIAQEVQEAQKIAVQERVSGDVEEPEVSPQIKSQTQTLEPAEISSSFEEEPPAAVPPNKIPPFRELAEFEMLLFDVRGLQLAVPLISLGSIHRLESEFTPIVGRADWYLGMYRIGDRNLQVVDTARWVMPSRMQHSSDEPYEFVIRLADTHWALACSSVQQAIRVERDEIKWRTQQGKRPWLAGTVISKMCALLDVESMARLLDEDKLQDTP